MRIAITGATGFSGAYMVRGMSRAGAAKRSDQSFARMLVEGSEVRPLVCDGDGVPHQRCGKPGSVHFAEI